MTESIEWSPTATVVEAPGADGPIGSIQIESNLDADDEDDFGERALERVCGNVTHSALALDDTDSIDGRDA